MVLGAETCHPFLLGKYLGRVVYMASRVAVTSTPRLAIDHLRPEEGNSKALLCPDAREKSMIFLRSASRIFSTVFCPSSSAYSIGG